MFYFLGIDPSYSKTGIALVNTINKEIKTVAISPPGTNKTYNDSIERAEYVVNEILAHNYTDDMNVIMEEPLLTSQMASRLGILSGIIATTLKNNNNITNIKTVAPNVVAATNRKVKGYTSKTKKRISSEKAHEYLEVFIKHGYTVEVYNDKLKADGTPRARKMSPDEAESLIMVILLLKEYKYVSDDLINDLIKVNNGLNVNYTLNNLKGE